MAISVGRSVRRSAAAGVLAAVAGCSALGSSPSPAAKAGTGSAGAAFIGSTGAVSFTIAATGDLLINMPVARQALADGRESGQAYDFRRMLSKIKPILGAADLAVCHVETPMSADDTSISGYPVFNTPHELADAISFAGYEGCSTASNHSIDRGLAGVDATLAALDRVHVAHAGTAGSAAEGVRAELHRVKGVLVAHLSYTYGTNGIPTPPGAPWSVNITSVRRILADAHAAKQSGAQFVVVSLHWGEEYQTQPTPLQQAQARAVLASPDVDLILGCHAHVLQPVEKIGGKYVIYGMGNLLSNQSPAVGLPAKTQDGAVLKAYVSRHGDRLLVDRVTYTPTYVEIGRYTVWPVAQALDDPATPSGLRSALRASWQRTQANEGALAGQPRGALPEIVPRAAWAPVLRTFDRRGSGQSAVGWAPAAEQTLATGGQLR